MLNKELFKLEIEKLFAVHGKDIADLPKNMLKNWYEELKTLDDETFLESVKRTKISPKPSLYYIAENLPGFKKEIDKSIEDYVRRMERKKKLNFVPIDPTM